MDFVLIFGRVRDAAVFALLKIRGSRPPFAPGSAREVSGNLAEAAFERARSLDPNLESAASNLIVNRVERGELGRAFDAATDDTLIPDTLQLGKALDLTDIEPHRQARVDGSAPTRPCA